jgi:hypothetical protein
MVLYKCTNNHGDKEMEIIPTIIAITLVVMAYIATTEVK